MSKKEYTVSYSDIRGVDLSSGDDTARCRLAYAMNMWRDYEGDGGSLIESVPGFRTILSLGEKIYSIFTQRGESESYIVVHAGTSLYRFAHSERDSLSSLSPIATVSAKKSSAYSYGYELFVLDGDGITRIDKSGNATRVGTSGAEPYIPTTYVNGEEYESRNLLTDKFCEEFLVSSTDLVAHGTPALLYRITDAEKKLAAVVGIKSPHPSTVEVPSFIKIGAASYRVSEIYDGALTGSSIVNLRINEGCVRIGKAALSGSKSLVSVRCPDTMSVIDSEAFSGCSSLRNVYVGTGMTKFGEDVFPGGLTQVTLHYIADSKSLTGVVGFDAIKNSVTVRAGSAERTVTVEIPVKTGARSISRVSSDGENITYSVSKREDEIISAVLITVDDSRTLEGKLIKIEGTAAEESDTGEMRNLFSGTGYTGSGVDAVCKMTLCESFDGRIFLAGNPALPNTVIYSSRDKSGRNNPLYFGTYNYFEDGVGAFPVISMLAAGDSLAVFKSGDDGGGSIFYHTPTSTDSHVIPRIYPVSYVHSGVVSLGESISFYDDPLFVSSGGIVGIDKRTVMLERCISTRSHNVNSYLLREDLKNATLTKWCGYLAILTSGRIYLADSRALFTHRSGTTEYEWFLIGDVGIYENATRVYRYSSVSIGGLDVSDTPDEPVQTTVMSQTDEGGNTLYFTEEGGKKLAVYPTEEFTGGTFSPATSAVSLDATYLYFGTDSGRVCIFNNDKRGVAPERIASDPEFDPIEYGRTHARKIHRDFYDFAGRRVRYSVRTARDNGSLPHLSKNTVKGSLAVKMKLGGTDPVNVEVGTDRSGYSECARLSSLGVDFSDFDFGALTLTTEYDTTVPIGEKEKGWLEKELAVYSDGFRSPIGLYSLTYRFTERGKIKMP